MKYKIDLSMSSSRLETEIYASSQNELQEKVKAFVRSNISEVWIVRAREPGESWGEKPNRFLVVRDEDRFDIEPDTGLMDVTRYKE